MVFWVLVFWVLMVWFSLNNSNADISNSDVAVSNSDADISNPDAAISNSDAAISSGRYPFEYFLRKTKKVFRRKHIENPTGRNDSWLSMIIGYCSTDIIVLILEY